MTNDRNVFTFLGEAIQAAQEEDTIAIIPPDGSDCEEIDDDVDDDVQEVDEVAGFLEVIPLDAADVNPNIDGAPPRKWSRRLRLDQLPVLSRVPDLHETFPLLENLTPLQIFVCSFLRRFLRRL